MGPTQLIKIHSITTAWFVMFLYDVLASLPQFMVLIIPVLFLLTGILVHYYPDFKPASYWQAALWIPVLAWLIFAAYVLAYGLLADALPDKYIFLIKPYLTLSGLFSIILVSTVFSLFAYTLFVNRAVYVNLFAGLLAALFSLAIAGTDTAVFIVEAALLLVCLCSATLIVQRLPKSQSSRPVKRSAT